MLGRGKVSSHFGHNRLIFLNLPRWHPRQESNLYFAKHMSADVCRYLNTFIQNTLFFGVDSTGHRKTSTDVLTFVLTSLYMASVWRHPKSQYWTACFTDKDGQRRKRSTKETNRRKAEAIADSFEKASRKKRTFSQLREVLHELHAEMTGEELRTTTVRAHVEAWLAEKTEETKPATLQFYKAATAKLLKSLGEKAEGDLADITRQDILTFRKSLAARLSPTSINHDLKCIRMVFKAAHREGLIPENPAESVETVKEQGRQTRRPFSVQELGVVLREADPEWRSMILFGIYTGQRLSDIASLTWANVDLRAQELRLTTAKTNRRMAIPLAPPLLKHLESLPSSDSPSTPLHPKARAWLEKAGKTSTLSNQFADILADAGLRNKVSHEKKRGGRSSRRISSELSFHSLRHTAVTMLKEAGIPAAVVMELIGHDSAAMSHHYTHVGAEALKKAAKVLPDLTS